ALSTLVKFKDHHLVKLPNDISLKQASLFEVASIGYQAANLIKIMECECDPIVQSSAKEILICGAGPVGLFCALAAEKIGYKVTLLEKVSSRAKKAADLGFKCLLLPQVLMSKDHHHKFNFIIDATGDVHGQGAFRYAPMLGSFRFKMVVVGKYLTNPKFEFSILNNMGASLSFMRGTPISALQSVVDEWKEDIVKWEPHLITHEYEFDEVEKAYETTSDLNSTCKIMIKVQD
ncbi:MAG: zinc-binding dehydrogenase, partial [Bacteriovoracaceae bacterium]|nr:zinc-binding dehydrogenase [Bacteriovoracaceae bacterium]